MVELYKILTIISVLAYWLLIAGITTRIVYKRRSIGVSLAWMMLIYVVPILGILLYFLVGEMNLGKTRAVRSKEMYGPYREWFRRLFAIQQYRPHNLSDYATPISHLCEKRLGIPTLANNQLTLKSSTETILTTLIEDIQQAQTSIHLEFYIWYPGGLADQVAEALIQAAQRDVAVRILLDAAGSRKFFNSKWPKLMRKAGIQLVSALSVSLVRMIFRRLDLRLHRKIVVIDNQIGYTGSMNLVDPKCFYQSAGVGEWIDVMVRITGSSVPVLNCILAWDWETETDQRMLPEPPKCLPQKEEPSDMVQVIPSGPGMPEDMIQQVLLLSIYQAKQSITITSPYFVPSENLLFALTAAALRGVEVNLIIPDKNDSMMVEWASRSFFGELLNAGVNIHRFRGGLLHTKSVVIDLHHSLIGTVNLDMRSLWLNFEVTLSVENLEFTQSLSEVQHQYMANSIKMDARQWRKRPLVKRLVEQFFYLFSPLL
ncbi:cardiolipin synthase [Shewanella frigidimarina]|uniref:cardiolipin synthase n=1 Tax=Shewanella frigidimarina TaxID=56812 RepID=UPI000F4D3A56|nr:cardiolipin synthase [Shewanella frigidimarina]RPA23472.1 cardiolipin synthase [Shewanella frigidimarina]